MIKCVFALVLLLHFSSAGICADFNLNKEMIARLNKLDRLYRADQLNISSPDALRMPNTEMRNNAELCVNVFTEELRLLLSNVSVHDESRNIITELEANLQHLTPRLLQTGHRCRMQQNVKSLTPFKPYSTFLKKLNRMQM